MIARIYRWTWRFGIDGRDVSCPSGHPFTVQEVWGENHPLRCAHKGRDGCEDCGRLIYLAPMLPYHADPFLYAVEVSAREGQEIKQFKTVDAILNFIYQRDNRAA